MNQWEKLADAQTLKKAVASLKNNNIEAIVVKMAKKQGRKFLIFYQRALR